MFDGSSFFLKSFLFLFLIAGSLFGLFLAYSLQVGNVVFVSLIFLSSVAIFVLLLKLWSLQNDDVPSVKTKLSRRYCVKRLLISLLCILSAIFAASYLAQHGYVLAAAVVYVFFAVLYFVLSKYLLSENRGTYYVEET